MPDEPDDSFFLEIERVASSLTIVDGNRSVDELRSLFDWLKESSAVSVDALPSPKRSDDDASERPRGLGGRVVHTKPTT